MNYVLVAFLILQYIMHHFERKDLYNRIMSKDLTEYKGQKTNYTPSAHEKVLKNWRRKSKGGEKEE
ncbi:MAG: hypothetical protein IJA60_02620 [Clostridia bacterium]|nr:hypothetical protein [Clostridia bacterium]